MADILAAAAFFIMAVTAVALFRVLRARIAAERMMAVQLLGTGGAAALLLLATATATPAIVDVALLLVLFAAFSCVAFVLGTEPAGPRASSKDGP